MRSSLRRSAAGAGALTGGGAVAFTAATGAVACTLVELASLALGCGGAGTGIGATGASAGVTLLPAAAAAADLAFLRLGGIAISCEA